MSWAARRRLFILLLIGFVVAVALLIVLLPTLHKASSCVDNIQNQGEAGIDCGGPCAYLCTEQEQQPTVLYTKAIGNGAGRTDVIAAVENKNATAAAKNVPYTVTLYGKGQVIVQTAMGTVDLAPGATAKIFIPGIASGNQAVVNAFLVIDPTSLKWFTMTSDRRTIPLVVGTRLSGTKNTPRVDATLANPSISALTNVKVIVLVHNDQDSVIAASQTIVPSILGQGQATATFTWNNGFSGIPASIEVVPVIPLP
jgi:hypothetical protein